MATKARFFLVTLRDVDNSWDVIIPSVSAAHVRSEMKYDNVRIDKVENLNWFEVDVYDSDGRGPEFSVKINNRRYDYVYGDDGYEYLRNQFINQFNKVVEDNYHD